MHALRAPAAMPLAIALITLVGIGVIAVTGGYAHFVIALVALTTLAGTGLNVLLVLTGLISFGHAGFYAIGAYASAILTLSGVSFWLALPLAGLASALVGGLLSVPAMRVKGPYLAMVTIAFGFIVEHGLIEGGALTGGQNGLFIAAGPTLLRWPLAERGLAGLAVIGAGMSLLGFHALRESRLGRAMRAVRDADTAAASLGFDPVIAGLGIAVVLVEHDMPLVMAASERILVMDAGRPIASGAPAQVRRDPTVLRAYHGGADTPARPRA